jgi:hypothetical protein
MKTLITGDFILDKHILKGNRLYTSSSEKIKGTEVKELKGGAYLTYELLIESLLKKIIADKSNTEKTINELQQKINEEGDKKKDELEKVLINAKKYLEILSKINVDTEIKTNLNNAKFNEFISSHPEYSSYIEWNCHSEKSKLNFDALGYGELKKNDVVPDFLEDEYNQYDSIVIDEANLGFRNLDLKLKDKTIILKMTYPFCEGKLWKNIIDGNNKLYTIVTLENLRKYEVKVSKAISWEQTALDLCFEITRNDKLKELLKSTYLIILIGSAGALLVQPDPIEKNTSFNLIFDPEFMEDEWEQKNGSSIGTGSAFTAGLLRDFVLDIHAFTEGNKKKIEKEKDPKKRVALENEKYKPNFPGLISTGLNYARVLKSQGLFYNDDKGKTQNYPIQKLADATNEKPFYYSSAFVPSPYLYKDSKIADNKKWEIGIGYLKNKKWSILENNYRYNNQKTVPFFSLARDIANYGPDMAQYAPRIKFGGFLSLDRSEIESLRNIKQLVLDYHFNNQIDRPLNIAVFGAPGAGKSFAVKQLASSIIPKENIQFLEYNLSQFKDSTQLKGAFHAVRDAVLRGQLPFVFWDEFDSKDLSWLKDLIAPMQDGKFLESGVLHPLGKCVFIFAGGTSNKMEEFDPQYFLTHESILEEKEDKELDILNKRVADFKMVKGPDFLSRINGYLDVLGPNKNQYWDPKNHTWVEDDSDVCYPVRRALFIRGVLRLKDEKLNMDWGLLSTLLELKKYIRGSRSMERLLNQLTLKDKEIILRSNLPSDEIIAMNVDYEDFMLKLYQDRKQEKFSETLAVNIHNAWMEFQVTESNFYNEYQKLNYDGRRDNIAAAKRIFSNFETSQEFKLELDHTNSVKDEDKFLDYIKIPEGQLVNKQLEVFAKLEHDGWFEERDNDKWVFGEVRNDYLGIHHCLKAYNELDDKEKEKDRNTIRKYVEFLKDTDYSIVKK